MRDRDYFVYMLASGHYGTLYIGVTNDILRRVGEHREGVVPGFTRRYGIKRLVWYEQHSDIHDAIAREKKLKRWRRDWKITLLEAENPHWIDLYPALCGHGSRVCTASLRAAVRPG
ncbi:MAG: GIY-YIG nuclease family protein [Alphaproteobacteria bacterium]|nr:GIY-YIG nuclease family protein [Alphaproteobacteria bacterium]